MELKGSIRNFPLPDVIQFIGSARRTGLLLVTLAGARASIFFENGMIVHADYRDLVGQAVINHLFLEQDGNFQFLVDATTDERNFVTEWMSAIMEAARVNDESAKDEADGLGDLEGGGAAAPKPPPHPAWDPAPVKARMRALLREAFGRQAAKIEQELEKCPPTKLGLLDFCTKAEKYIYVFIDTARSRPVAEQLRSVVEEPLP